MGFNPRISSGPAAIQAAQTGRTYDCTRPYCTNAHKNSCQTGASTYDNATSGPTGVIDPHQQAEDMTAPTIKRNAAKKPLISGRHPDMSMPGHEVPDGTLTR